MSTQPRNLLTPEEYLEIERKADFKSEYYRGEMFAMSGATREHNILVGNTFRELSLQLRHGPCEIYSNDMRVRVSPPGLYTYPDIVVACVDRHYLDPRRDTLLNPQFIVEVLSPSTEAYDRGRRFGHYRSIESLRQYLLVAADRVQVDLLTRQVGGGWLMTSWESLEDVLEVESIGCRLTLFDMYERLSFPADPAIA